MYGDQALDRIGRDMLLVREFADAQFDQAEGSYLDVSYIHAGPAHLSIGQEAAAVGQAFTLGAEDKVFGSHRSHGEVIAKGLSAITSRDHDFLFDALSSWSDGAIWKVVEKRLADADFEQQAINYLLYGMTAETFGRRTGFNRGLGGSMHAFLPPLGIYPNNAIVGGSAPWPPAPPCTTGFRRRLAWWSPALAMLPRGPVRSGSPSISLPWRS